MWRPVHAALMTPVVGVLIGTVTVAGLASAARAQAPTDNCRDAPFVAVPGAYSGTTLGATNDGTAACGESAASPDVWVRFTSTSSEAVLAQLCGSGYDSVISAHTACGSPSFACNDDSSCDLQSRLIFEVSQGTTYLVRISGYQGSTGSVMLSLSYTQRPPPPPPLNPGPDVIVGDLNGIVRFTEINGVAAYAVGTTSCNIGDQDVLWVGATNEHPVIGQAIYRLHAGRIEQLGQSWLKHGFAAINNGICGECNGHLGQVLGSRCSDPYGATLNGEQSILGPKWQVNATTGEFPYPPANPSYSSQLARRIQVSVGEIDPSLFAGALFFAEGAYITADDAVAGNGLNNASYRPVTFNAGVPSFSGDTQRTRPAIRAWRDNDPAVTEALADYVESGLTARFIVASKATQNPGGTWRFEYAVYNLNSNRSARSFTVPVPPGAVITNLRFRDVPYHSGDGMNNTTFDGTDWTASVQNGQVTWSTSTFEANANANALRFATMYNFRFDSSVGPTPGDVTLGLFKPGDAGDPASTHASGIPVPGCLADVDHNGIVNSDDFFSFLAALFNENADFNHDGVTNSQDFYEFLLVFFAGC